jgi:4-amino-4-deoxy-L-arabinose transferase-like glycosyltransferase
MEVKEKAQTNTRALMAALLGVAFVYWLWFGLTQRSVTTDPGISILAARSILEHGYPLLPSGFIYYKGALPNYLLAGSIGAFGLNDFSIILPSLLMGLGSLFLVYLLGRDVLGRSWIGVAAAAILITIETQSYYAASPRMYMSLQLFTVLAAYSAWHGHIKGRRVFEVITVLAVAGAMLSHPQGGVLVVAVPLTVLAIKWLKQGVRPSMHDLRPLTGLIVLGVVYVVFFLLYELPQSLQLTALRGGTIGKQSGLNLDPAGWARHINWLEHTVPFGLLLLPVVAMQGFRALQERRREGSIGTLYLLMLFGVWALGVLGYIRIQGTRFWIGISPVYVLVLLLSINMLSNWLVSGTSDSTPREFRPALRFAGLIGWAAAVILGASLYYGPMGYPNIVRAGYGIPCSDDDADCSRGVEAQYVALRPLVGENDLIISTNPLTSSYYLSRIDGWFVQRWVGTGLTAFDSSTDEYFGIPLIDTHDELLELKHSPRRVWIITSTRQLRYLSVDMMDLLQKAFRAFGERGPLTVYVNSAE